MDRRLNHARYISSHSDYVYIPGSEWDLPANPASGSQRCQVLSRRNDRWANVFIAADPTSRHQAMCVARLLVGNPDTAR